MMTTLDRPDRRSAVDSDPDPLPTASATPEGGIAGEGPRLDLIWAGLRTLIGFTFLWAFLDKMFGLGFATCRTVDGAIDVGCDQAMISGGSPTYGFLTFATEGSHTGWMFDWMASSGPDVIGLADLAFMAALLLGGVALMTGVAVRTAAIGGAVLLACMYLAADVWPDNNPFVNSHLIEIVALLGVARVGSGPYGLHRWLARRRPLIRMLP